MIEPSEEEKAVALLRVITLLESERACLAKRVVELEQERDAREESLPPPASVAGAAEAVFAAASVRLRALEREVQECKGEIAARGAVLAAIVATCKRLHEARRAPLHVSASGLDAPDRDV